MKRLLIRLAGPLGVVGSFLLVSSPAMGGVSVVHTPPATAPVRAAAARPAGAYEDPEAELMRSRAELQKAYESLNALNPLSADYGKSPSGAQAAPTGAAANPLADLQKILSHPAFRRGIDQIMNSPQRLNLLYAELGLILFMIVFRAWRFSKSTHWARRLWTNVWTFCLYWVAAGVLVPWGVLGGPFYDLLSGAALVLMGPS